MSYYQKQSMMKSKHQLEQKLKQISKLENKLKQMNKKITYKGYQKVSSVMMRNVQVKHTSQLMIKLNDEYFVEVKTHTALEYLARRTKKYEDQLKKVNLKIQVMEEKNKKSSKPQSIPQKTYAKSTLESIGKNDEGDQIFNIIEFQEQPETLPTNAQINNSITQQAPLINKELPQKQPVKQTKPTPTTSNSKIIDNKSSSGEQSEQGGDLIFDRAQYSSEQSSLGQIQQQENDEELKITQNSKSEPKNQDGQLQKPSAIKADTVLNQTRTISKQSIVKPVQSRPSQQISKPVQTQSKQKPQTKATKATKEQPAQQPPKQISRFKLERMKQKLQSSIQ